MCVLDNQVQLAMRTKDILVKTTKSVFLHSRLIIFAEFLSTGLLFKDNASKYHEARSNVPSLFFPSMIVIQYLCPTLSPIPLTSHRFLLRHTDSSYVTPIPLTSPLIHQGTTVTVCIESCNINVIANTSSRYYTGPRYDNAYRTIL
jgi:hypothetical protein